MLKLLFLTIGFIIGLIIGLIIMATMAVSSDCSRMEEIEEWKRLYYENLQKSR